jgi:hypothetical protein
MQAALHSVTQQPRAESDDEAWALGDLWHLCDGWQREAHDWFWESHGASPLICVARRGGKTTLGAVFVYETVLLVRRLLGRPAIVRIASGTGVDLAENVEPAMRLVGEEAPSWARATYKAPGAQSPGRYEWPDGSRAVIAGVNGGREQRLRGREADLSWTEEGSIIDRLAVLHDSILRPQLMKARARIHIDELGGVARRIRFGRALITMTPAETPAHESTARVARAEATGQLFTRTIYELNMSHLTPEVIEEAKEEMGGEDSTTWKREALVLFVTDKRSAVVPEFQDHEASIVEERERPAYFVPRIAMDVGYNDLTVAVFGYHDFDAGLDVITHEVVLEHATSDEINEAVAEVEHEAFGDVEKLRHRIARFADASETVIAGLRRKLKISREMEQAAKEIEDADQRAVALGWSLARKDDAAAALNDLRRGIARHTVRINPRCVVTRAHLRHGIWNKARTSYKRDSDENNHLGHYDGIDAAKMLLRHLDRQTNPFPARAPDVRWETHRIRKSVPPERPYLYALARMLKGSRR